MVVFISRIRLFVPVENQNPMVQPPRPTYECVTHGGNTIPQEFEVEPGIPVFTLGDVEVPNAILGGNGTYSIAAVRWDIMKIGKDVRSQVEVSGTVTYVTVEDPTEITHSQTIKMTCRWRVGAVPLDPPSMSLDGRAPITTLTMWIKAGNANVVAAHDEDEDAIFAEENTVEVEQVLTQQHKKQSPVESQS